jgi:transposase InsO family protein
VFLAIVDQHGRPAATLTDNGTVYTSRFTGRRNAFKYVPALLGISQKNGAPGHPQTQGKTERFHQTLQRWLRARPPARTLTELGHQLDQFREHYNE